MLRNEQKILFLFILLYIFIYKVQENQILFFIGLIVFLISLIITMTSVKETPKNSKKMIAMKEQGFSSLIFNLFSKNVWNLKELNILIKVSENHMNEKRIGIIAFYKSFLSVLFIFY